MTAGRRKLAETLLHQAERFVPEWPVATVTVVTTGGGTDGVDLVTVDYAGATLTMPHMKHYTAVVGDVVALGRWGGQWHIVGCPGGFPPPST